MSYWKNLFQYWNKELGMVRLEIFFYSSVLKTILTFVEEFPVLLLSM